MLKRKIGLKWKILVVNLISSLTIILLLNTFVSYELKKLSRSNFEKALQVTSSDYAGEMKFDWIAQFSAGKIIQNGLVDLWESGNVSRKSIDEYLYNHFEKDAHAVGMGFAVPPNSFDGRDERYIGKEGYDDTGCFKPFYYRDTSGDIHKTVWDKGFEKQKDFTEPFETQREYIQNPYMHEMDMKDRFIMSMNFPVVVGGEVKGVIKLQNDITDKLSMMMAYKPFNAGHVAMVDNNTSKIIGHPNYDKIGKIIRQFSDFPLVKQKGDFLKALYEKKPSIFKENGTLIYSYPIDIEGLNINNSIILKIDLDKLETDEALYSKKIHRFFMFWLLISIICSYLLAVKISKPLEGLNTMIVDLSQGEGDLTQEIHITSRDEIGEIGHNTNIFVSHLHGIIQEIKTSMSSLSTLSHTLASSSDESSAAIEQINRNLEHIGHEVQELVNSLDANKSNQFFLTKSMKEVANAATEQSEVIDGTSAAIAQMSASVKNVYENTNQKIELVKTVQKKTRDSSSHMALSVQAIESVQASANTIRELLTVIEDVANQTNLLAMNAAIEAAHAGEAGRGFAVVADEIRKLATSSTQSSAEMDKSITMVLDHIAETGNRFLETNTYFQEMINNVQEVTDAMVETKDAMTELSAGSDSIVASLVQINKSSTDLADKSQKMRDVMKDQNMILKESEKRFETVNSGFIEVNIGMKEILQTAEVVKSAGVKNQENIRNISNLVERFKTKKK